MSYELPSNRSFLDAQHALSNEKINIASAVAAFFEFKWAVLAITLLAITVGVIVAYSKTPIYKADALIQIDEKGKARLSILKDLEPVLGDSTSIAAELEILSSRFVLGRAVDALHLNISAEPRFFPIVGRSFARGNNVRGSQAPLAGLGAFGWGGEVIGVDLFEVPSNQEDERYVLTAGNNDSYTLKDNAGQDVLEGRVGQRSSANGVALTLNELKARPGTQFNLSRYSDESAIAQVRSQFTARERNKGAGIVEATLFGGDPAKITALLTKIVEIYYNQNKERKATETANQLSFLEKQLPLLKTELDSAEAAYNSFRQSRGTVDLPLETEGVLKTLIDVDSELGKLRQDRAELRQSFTAEHPRVIAVDNKIALLQGRRSALDKGVSQLPDTQQTALRLKRNMDAASTLYLGLLTTAQQLAVSKAGTVGEVRVIDVPRLTRLPVEPKKGVIVSTAALAGLALSLVYVAARRLLRFTVNDPYSIERNLNIPGLANIPHSRAQRTRAQGRTQKHSSDKGPLSYTSPKDDTVESFRTLRTSIRLALGDASRRSVQIVGSKEDIGKTFVASNLAAVAAQAGLKVVLIDADLRRGRLHHEFSLAREGGLSEYLAGRLTLEAALRRTGIDGLYVMTTGALIQDPSLLLGSEIFRELVLQLESSYDLVIIDTPPILAVSDAILIGRVVGLSVLVTRSGRHAMAELEQTAKTLGQAGVQLNGFVFNDLDLDRQKYRYGHESHIYNYRYRSAAE